MVIVTRTIKKYFKTYSGLPLTCWHGIILSLLQSILMDIYYFFPLYFTEQLHLNIATTGIIISLYGAGTILGGIIGGKLSDKISPNYIIISSLIGHGIIFLILPHLKSIFQMTLAIIMAGIAAY